MKYFEIKGQLDVEKEGRKTSPAISSNQFIKLEFQTFNGSLLLITREKS